MRGEPIPPPDESAAPGVGFPLNQSPPADRYTPLDLRWVPGRQRPHPAGMAWALGLFAVT